MADDDLEYRKQIGQIRAERAQRDIAEAREQVAEEWRQAEREREAALEQQDPEGWEVWDRESERLGREYAQLTPPPQPQLSQKATAYLQQRESFTRRYGDRAVQAYQAGHQHAVSAGLVPDTDDYYKFVDNTLELNGPSFNGIKFDPNEKALTPNEACQISGVTPDLYNKMRSKILNQGQNSNTLYGQQWKRTVG